jgi:hypothetical protein
MMKAVHKIGELSKFTLQDPIDLLLSIAVFLLVFFGLAIIWSL